MRRCIVVSCRAPNGQMVPRLYTMTHFQATLFRDTLRRTAGVDRAAAELSLERVVVRMLAGESKLTEDCHPALAQLQAAFPRLVGKRVAALPRSGCPAGWIEAIVMTLNVDEGRTRCILYKFTQQQAIAFNNALTAIQGVTQCDRDQAWLAAQKAVGRLIGGARPGDGAEPLLAHLADAFPAEELRDVVRRPAADEQDLARWSFTREPMETP